jgi:hypothetical protein
LKLEDDSMAQLDLFEEALRIQKFSRIYQAVDHMREKFGTHTVFLGSSFLAHRFQQHPGERGDEPRRRRVLPRGETKRKRLGIPLFMGEVK